MAAKKTLTDIEKQIKALEDERAKLQKEAQKDAEALISAAGNLGISLPETVLVGALLKAKELLRANDPLAEEMREAGATFLGRKFRRSKATDAAAESASDESPRPEDNNAPEYDRDSSSATQSKPESGDESKAIQSRSAAERSQPPIRLSPERVQGGTLV